MMLLRPVAPNKKEATLKYFPKLRDSIVSRLPALRFARHLPEKARLGQGTFLTETELEVVHP